MVWVAGQGLAAELERTPLAATTADGQAVHLYPNGRWAFVDAARAAEAQGGVFGVGRTIMPGDKDYNRGSLNPKLR
jgi:hypothetical protein